MPEEGGSFLQNRVMGIPIWIWLIIAAIAVYFIYQHFAGGQSSVPPTTGGGGGTATQSVRLQKGAVRISIDTDHEQPKPPVHERHGGHHKHVPPDRNPPPHRNPPEPPKKKWGNK